MKRSPALIKLERELAEIRLELSISRARHTATLAKLERMVRQRERIGGYSTPEDQSELWDARADLAENGR